MVALIFDRVNNVTAYSTISNIICFFANIAFEHGELQRQRMPFAVNKTKKWQATTETLWNC